jgi:hypothetical protein
MADAPLRKGFTFQELTLLMIKERKIHKGYWHLYTTFGFSATNMKQPDGIYVPAIIAPVVELGIEETPQPDERSLDATKVNPAPMKKKRLPAKTKRPKSK